MSDNINKSWRVTKKAAHGRGVVAADALVRMRKS